jgi:hypothetical protein
MYSLQRKFQYFVVLATAVSRQWPSGGMIAYKTAL